MKKKSQLNIKIDPMLLIKLKSEAIRNGKTLSAFISERLEKFPDNIMDDRLEKRLLKIEEKLKLLQDFTSRKEFYSQNKRIFSDKGAKVYGEVARELFELHRKEKKLSIEDAFTELGNFLANYESQPELVYELLVGNHELTGIEMTDAYRNGSCGMRSALSDWTNNSLEPLNEAFLNAVETENLV